MTILHDIWIKAIRGNFRTRFYSHAVLLVLGSEVCRLKKVIYLLPLEMLGSAIGCGALGQSELVAASNDVQSLHEFKASQHAQNVH